MFNSFRFGNRWYYNHENKFTTQVANIFRAAWEQKAYMGEQVWRFTKKCLQVILMVALWVVMNPIFFIVLGILFNPVLFAIWALIWPKSMADFISDKGNEDAELYFLAWGAFVWFGLDRLTAKMLPWRVKKAILLQNKFKNSSEEERRRYFRKGFPMEQLEMVENSWLEGKDIDVLWDEMDDVLHEAVIKNYNIKDSWFKTLLERKEKDNVMAIINKYSTLSEGKLLLMFNEPADSKIFKALINYICLKGATNSLIKKAYELDTTDEKRLEVEKAIRLFSQREAVKNLRGEDFVNFLKQEKLDLRPGAQYLMEQFQYQAFLDLGLKLDSAVLEYFLGLDCKDNCWMQYTIIKYETEAVKANPKAMSLVRNQKNLFEYFLKATAEENSDKSADENATVD